MQGGTSKVRAEDVQEVAGLGGNSLSKVGAHAEFSGH